MTRENLIDRFNTLIAEYGEGGKLDFSVYCEDLPVLSGKLIFGIGFKGGGIAFYYDCDLKDYAMFGDFNEDELYDFYKNVVAEIYSAPRQYRVVVTADEGYVADALRRIANWIENNGEDYPYEYEDCNCTAIVEEV